MLDVFRRHSGGFVAKVILALLIISFAAWGIGDMLRQRAMHMEVARVGKVSITRMDIEREMQQDISQLHDRLGANYKPELIKMLNLPEQVMKRMVSQQLMKQEIADLGIQPGEEMVAELIRANPAFADKSGKFSKEYFLQVLKQNHFTEADYVGRLKEDMATRLISQSIVGYSEVPDMAVKVLKAADGEKRTVAIYQLDTSHIQAPEPTDEDIKEYFQSVSSRYATPEYRSVSYVEMDESSIGDVKVSDEAIQRAYQERKDEFTTPEYRDFEQLLYSDETKAKEVEVALKSGKPAKEVAKEIPPVNAGNLEIKQASQKALPEDIQATAFAMKEGDISAPIKSSFGYHVLKLNNIEASKVKSLDEVRAQLEKELKPGAVNDALAAKANKLDDMMAGGASLADAAKELGLKVEHVQDFDLQGKVPSGAKVALPQLNNFVKVAFATDEASDSTVNLGRPGVYYMVHVDKVIPEKFPPLESIKAELVQQWKLSKLGTLEKAAADELSGKLADVKQRDEVLKSNQVKPYVSGSISRQDIALGGHDLSAALVQDIFATDVNDTTEAHQLPNRSYVIAVVNSSAMPDLLSNEQLAKDKGAEKLRQSIRGNMQQELMGEYMEYLTKKYHVNVNHNALAAIAQSAAE